MSIGGSGVAYGGHEYHDQVEKYGYIFRTPEIIKDHPQQQHYQ